MSRGGGLDRHGGAAPRANPAFRAVKHWCRLTPAAYGPRMSEKSAEDAGLTRYVVIGVVTGMISGPVLGILVPSIGVGFGISIGLMLGILGAVIAWFTVRPKR